jgi:hypothetical protein
MVSRHGVRLPAQGRTLTIFLTGSMICACCFECCYLRRLPLGLEPDKQQKAELKRKYLIAL